MRVTTKDVGIRFARFCKMFGFKMSAGYRKGERYPDTGLALDHNATYGGWSIIEYQKDSTAEFQPFGAGRFKSSQFVDMLGFAERAAQYAKEK